MYLSQYFQFFITCLLCCTLLIFITFEIHSKTITTQRTPITYNNNNKINNNNNIKTIVAYSLQKQIEIETKQITDCNNNNNNNGDEVLMKNDENAIVVNDNWIHVAESNLYYYSAFYDTRLDRYPYVRIIGMVQGAVQNSYFCQLWNTEDSTETTKPYTVEAIIHLIWTNEWNQNDSTIYYNPILISCPVITIHKPPQYVILSKDPCEEISKHKYKKKIQHQSADETVKNFTVCVKNLNYKHDISDELIPWLEIHRLLGVNSVYLYIENITMALDTTINNYVNKFSNENFNIVKKTVPSVNNDKLLRYSKNERIWQQRRDYLVTYNDCFYNNIYSSRYVVLVDLDEIIVPRIVDTWNQLFSTFLYKYENKYASFMVQNAFFFLNKSTTSHNNSSQNYLLNKIYRSKYSPKGESGKSFMSTKYSLTVFNHYTFESLLPGVSRTYFVPNKYVQLNHYRQNCPYDILPECKKYIVNRIRDTIMLKYGKQLLNNIDHVKKAFLRIL